MTTAYLALGSNQTSRQGDALENLRFALRQLAAQPQLEIAARSQIYRTQSVEGGGENDFLNAALRIETALSPHELLDVTQRIEIECGREPSQSGQHRHGARVLDIDILLFGEAEVNDARLELPHPRLGYRAFVLRPLLDVLAGGWVETTELEWN